MPRTSESIPLISVYLILTLAMIGLVILLQVVILNVHMAHKHLPPVPQWLHALLVDGVAFILRMDVGKQHSYWSTKCRNHNPNNNKHIIVDEERNDSLRGSPSPIQLQKRKLKNTMEDMVGEVLADAQKIEEIARRKSLASLKMNNKDIKPKNEDTQGLCKTVILSQLADLLAYLSVKVYKSRRCDDYACEWRLIAIIMNRLLFWVVFCLFFSINFYLLVALPLARHYNHQHYFFN